MNGNMVWDIDDHREGGAVWYRDARADEMQPSGNCFYGQKPESHKLLVARWPGKPGAVGAESVSTALRMRIAQRQE